MAAGLKSISGRIHWSLLLRAVVFGFGWFLLPFWLFVIIALYLYLLPFFGVRKLALAFLAVIFFAAIEPKGFLFAVVFSGLFYLILGVKDLVFIQRKSAYEILALLLVFLAFIEFFPRFGSGVSLRGSLGVLVVGVFVFLLVRGFLNYGADSADGAASAGRRTWRGGVFAAVTALVVSQVMVAALFTPLNYLYQSALAFLAAALVVELSSDHLDGKLTRRAVLADASIFLVFLVIILGSASWSL